MFATGEQMLHTLWGWCGLGGWDEVVVGVSGERGVFGGAITVNSVVLLDHSFDVLSVILHQHCRLSCEQKRLLGYMRSSMVRSGQRAPGRQQHSLLVLH